MSRLIYEDDVIKMLDHGWLSGKYPHIYEVHNLPTAQPEIIQCKDCVHHIDGFFCRQANHHTSDSDHCAIVFGAERRVE